jgi:hypothetical protein
MNEIINKTKTNIEGLNQRFFLILEHFVPTYIKSLQNPQDTAVANEISHINTVTTQIESDGFTIKNAMESTIATDQGKINKLNTDIRILKKENEKLKEQRKELNTTTITSVGLFDDELEWYKQQIKIIVVMLIGIIIVGKVYYGFKVPAMEIVKTIGIVIVLGIIFETLIMYLYDKLRYGNSDEPK